MLTFNPANRVFFTSSYVRDIAIEKKNSNNEYDEYNAKLIEFDIEDENDKKNIRSICDMREFRSFGDELYKDLYKDLHIYNYIVYDKKHCFALVKNEEKDLTNVDKNNVLGIYTLYEPRNQKEPVFIPYFMTNKKYRNDYGRKLEYAGIGHGMDESAKEMFPDKSLVLHSSYASMDFWEKEDYQNTEERTFIYTHEIEKLKSEVKEFPKDIEYRKNLLANAGLNPASYYKIRSIIGAEELKSLMEKYNENEINYSSGENFSNVENYGIRANFHIHTLSSDGALTTQELLDKAVEYADNSAKNNPDAKAPFTIAITDHDTLESTREAIRIISENPVKYKNLRVVLGVEMTTFNNVAPNLVSTPTNTHVLCYGIDPNEEIFKSFIDGTKDKKRNLETMMIGTANKIYEEKTGVEYFFDLGQAKKLYNPLSKNITGIYNNLDMYFRNKIAIEHIVTKDEKVKEALREHNIPVDTDELMKKLSEYKHFMDGNNRVESPLKTLPPFLSEYIGMDIEDAKQIIVDGLEDNDVSELNRSIKENIEQYKVTFNPKYDYMPTFETLYSGLKGQDNVIIGIAHPLDTVASVEGKDNKYEFLEDLYSKFKCGCKEKAKFSEVYYQSYKGDTKSLKEDSETKQFMNDISKKYNLYKTGSQDTHRKNIFIR